MKQLVASWIEAERQHHGNSLGEAVRQLNALLYTHVTCSRVSEWRRGVYCPKQAVLSHMLYRALPWILEKANVPAADEHFQRLKRMLWVIEEKDGKAVRYFL